MTRRILYIIFLVFLLADVSYSFKQHYSQPLDGDMAGGIVPANDVKPVLNDPFGTGAFLKHKKYPNPNRFFSHWLFKEYFNTIPLLLQKFTDPVNSIYLSCAIAKTAIQVALIILLCIAVTGSVKLLSFDFLLVAVLITPLFQTNGYQGYMGIIDISVTYTFFYALPFVFLLLYLLPFVNRLYFNKRLPVQLFIKIFWVPLALVVCLSGPLNPGVVLVFSGIILYLNIRMNYLKLDNKYAVKRWINAILLTPKGHWFFLLPISLISLYSLYLGRYNSINIVSRIPLTELYLRLPEGIYYQFTQKLGFPVLFTMLILNSVIIYRYYRTTEGEKILNVFKWIGIFTLLYILLLPLGGYRSYRPYVLRYDTIMPVTLSLMFVFGTTSFFLLKNMKKNHRFWYSIIIGCVLLIYTNADEAKFDKNKHEKLALKAISVSKDSIVELQDDCNVLSWDRISKPDDSELNAQLLTIWKVTQKKRLYYNK